MKEKLKPRILCDTREQLSLADTFNKERFDIVTEGLPFGDYFAEIPNTDGTYTQPPICFERKGFQDLWTTLVPCKSNPDCHERFKRELDRAKKAGFHIILVVEGTIRDVHKGSKHSTFSGESMLKKLAMLRVRYDLEVLFFEDRRSMARWIEEVFDAVHRNYLKPKS